MNKKLKEFDYIGLKCPIPVLKAFKEIKKNPLENNFNFYVMIKQLQKISKTFALILI